MRKIALKLFKILLIFQILICISNINIVSADTTTTTFQNIDQQGELWEDVGTNQVSLFGLNTLALTEPLALGLSVVHFIAVAIATGKLLITALGIIKDDHFEKAKAKKSLQLDLILLFVALVGVGWVKKFILMIV